MMTTLRKTLASFTLCFTAVLAWAADDAVPSPCMPLFPRGIVYQDAAILASGTYCLAADFMQKKLSGAGHTGPTRGHALIEIFGGDIVIDLQKHTLHSDFNSDGVLATAGSNRGWAEREKRSFGLHTTNITIKNGTIDLRGIGTGIDLINRWSMTKIDQAIPDDLIGYEKSRFVLENLLIKTDNVGIQLEGDGNIIRNCVIESAGDAAIMMAGPNGRITNNKIVFTNPLIPTWHTSSRSDDIGRLLWELPQARKQVRAAIVLHQATGTLISDNQITVEGGSKTRHSIYLRDQSKNVLIENNTFTDAESPVTLQDGSTAQLKNNKMEQRKKSWWNVGG
jgi:hypothetical protein